MKLTVETVRIKDLQFGESTSLRDGVLYVSKEDILAFAVGEPCFDTLKIDIARPGCRSLLSKVSLLSAACSRVAFASITLVLKPTRRSASRYSRKSASAGVSGSMTSMGIFA